MKIIIKRKPDYITGHMSALLLSDDSNVPGVRVSYGAATPISTANLAHQSYEESFYNDVFTFNSEANYDDVIMHLRTSIFNNSENCAYDKNCVDAVEWAMQVAGINIEVDTSIRLKHLVWMYYCPTSIKTPADLINAAKEYKCDEFRHNGMNDSFFRLIEKLSSQPLMNNLRNNIEDAQESHPHRTDHLVYLLTQCDNTLNDCSPSALVELRKHATNYKRKLNDVSMQLLVALGCILFVTSGSYVLSYKSRFFGNTHHIQTGLLSVATLVLILGFGLCVGNLLYKDARVETPLSRAIVDLAAQLELQLLSDSTADERVGLLSQRVNI